jgi:endonuclease IV
LETAVSNACLTAKARSDEFPIILETPDNDKWVDEIKSLYGMAKS